MVFDHHEGRHTSTHSPLHGDLSKDGETNVCAHRATLQRVTQTSTQRHEVVFNVVTVEFSAAEDDSLVHLEGRDGLD